MNEIVKKYFNGCKKEYNTYTREKRHLLEDFCIKEIPTHMEAIFNILTKGVKENKTFYATDIAVERYCRELINKELEV